MAESKTKAQASAPAAAYDPQAAAEPKAMTAAQAAKRVVRPVMADDGTSFAAVTAAEVLSFRDCGTHVIVVTVDGQKLNSRDAGGADESAG